MDLKMSDQPRMRAAGRIQAQADGHIVALRLSLAASKLSTMSLVEDEIVTTLSQ